jgi:nucleotide-binding universal stress UspA family protein
MSGVILAVPDRPDCAARVLTAAARFAELTRSTRINVLAIRMPPMATILPSEQILTRRDELRIRNDEQSRTHVLKGTYDVWSSGDEVAPDTVTEWVDVEGMADELVNEWGRRADFIVLKRPSVHWSEPERRAIRAALFDTARPVLLVPPESQPVPFGHRIAIAWRDDGSTVKAVLSTLRWVGRAKEIHVLAGARDASVQPSLPDILDEHGIQATLHVLQITGQQAFGEVLLDAAHALGADMLVMGAFARHPVRSLILGG